MLPGGEWVSGRNSAFDLQRCAKRERIKVLAEDVHARQESGGVSRGRNGDFTRRCGLPGQ